MTAPHMLEHADQADAFAEMCEAIEQGDLATAKSLAKEYDVPLSLVWAPEDDYLDPTPGSEHTRSGSRR